MLALKEHVFHEQAFDSQDVIRKINTELKLTVSIYNTFAEVFTFVRYIQSQKKSAWKIMNTRFFL